MEKKKYESRSFRLHDMLENVKIVTTRPGLPYLDQFYTVDFRDKEARLNSEPVKSDNKWENNSNSFDDHVSHCLAVFWYDLFFWGVGWGLQIVSIVNISYIWYMFMIVWQSIRIVSEWT